MDYTVKIRKVENGFLVGVGCKRFVFVDKEELFGGVKLYFTSPKKAAAKFCPEYFKEAKETTENMVQAVPEYDEISDL